MGRSVILHNPYIEPLYIYGSHSVPVLLMGRRNSRSRGLAALTLFVGIVPVILYGLMQKYIIQGLLRGALKYG
jgi:ABC-type glycerol-3-phosphate transport system permease component